MDKQTTTQAHLAEHRSARVGSHQARREIRMVMRQGGRMNAATLLRTVAESVAGIHEPTARMGQQVGQLQAIVRGLFTEYTGDGVKPQPGCAFATVIAGDASVLVEYEYEPGEASQTSGPPEKCYEGYAASVAIIQALVNGRWCDPADVFSDALIERWTEQIAESEDEQAREAREPPERDRYDDARDFAEAAA